MNPTPTQETGPPPSCIGQRGRPMARPWERPKARAKARARARARASNGLMCVKEGRPNVMLKETQREKLLPQVGPEPTTFCFHGRCSTLCHRDSW